MKGASLIAPFGLRMPEELKEKVAERAKNNGRSMNAGIVQILQDALDSHPNDDLINELQGISFTHGDEHGMRHYESADEIAKYIEEHTEKFKRSMIEGLMTFKKGDN